MAKCFSVNFMKMWQECNSLNESSEIRETQRFEWRRLVSKRFFDAILPRKDVKEIKKSKFFVKGNWKTLLKSFKIFFIWIFRQSYTLYQCCPICHHPSKPIWMKIFNENNFWSAINSKLTQLIKSSITKSQL